MKPRLLLPLLLVGTLALYASFLARAPVYLNNDEAAFAVQAHAIAFTGRDMNGRLLPVYFNMLPAVWYQPVIVYWMSLFLRVLPLTEWSVRLPTVAVAVLDVWLCVLVTRRIFHSEVMAVAAGALLALTPAHFIHGRLACDYLYPVPFVLVWLLSLCVFVERRRPWLLLAGGVALGIGFYSYIASIVMMPLYLALGCTVLAATHEKPLRPCLVFGAGFLAALAPLVLWLPSHLDTFYGTAGRYRMPTRVHLAIPEHLGRHALVYLRFFDPVHLFIRDRGAVTSSTHRAGVFAFSMIALLPLGMYEVLRRRRSPLSLLVVAGFVAAPVAAAFINESYTTDRALGLLPFGAVLGGAGIGRLLAVRSGPLRLAAVGLLVALPVQFAYFYADYLTGYRVRSAFWFNGNNRGALEEILAAEPRIDPRPVYVADNIPFIDFYMKLYLIKHHREDLLPHVVYFNLTNLDVAAMPRDSFILTNVDAVEQALIASQRFTELKKITEPDGTTAFARLQRSTMK